jgi:competence protein ComFC
VRSKRWPIELLIPVPPSSTRSFQPVLVLAKKLAEALRVKYFSDCITKVKDTPQLKNVSDADEHKKLLADAFVSDRSKVRGKSILLFDDLYRSGATMNEVSSSLQKSGRTDHIYALALTMKRVHRLKKSSLAGLDD